MRKINETSIRRKVVITFLLLPILSVTAESAPVIYTDEAAWQAAISGAPVRVEDFESTPIGSLSEGSNDFGGFNVIIDAVGQNSIAFDLDFSGNRHLAADLGNPLWMTFDQPLRGFAADWDLTTSNSTITLMTVNGVPFRFDDYFTDDFGGGFLGVVDLTNPITSVSFEAESPELAVTTAWFADNVRFASSESSIILYRSNPIGPETSGNLDGRSGADSFCRTSDQKPYGYANYRAFISVAPGDAIKDMPSNYGVPINQEILGPNGTRIANNWTDLLEGGPVVSLFDAGVFNFEFSSWWSGSTAAGEADATCRSWTTKDPLIGETGTIGLANRTDSGWLQHEFDGFDLTCAEWVPVVCIAFDPNLVGAVPSDLGASSEKTSQADDFEIQPSEILTDIHWWGLYASADTPPIGDNFTIRIYGVDPSTGGPDETNVLYDTNIGSVRRTSVSPPTTVLGSGLYKYWVDIPSLYLSPGRYFLSIVNNLALDSDDDWYWAMSNAAVGDAWFKFIDPPWQQGSSELAFKFPGMSPMSESCSLISAEGPCSVESGTPLTPNDFNIIVDGSPIDPDSLSISPSTLSTNSQVSSKSVTITSTECDGSVTATVTVVNPNVITEKPVTLPFNFQQKIFDDLSTVGTCNRRPSFSNLTFSLEESKLCCPDSSPACVQDKINIFGESESPISLGGLLCETTEKNIPFIYSMDVDVRFFPDYTYSIDGETATCEGGDLCGNYSLDLNAGWAVKDVIKRRRVLRADLEVRTSQQNKLQQPNLCYVNQKGLCLKLEQCIQFRVQGSVTTLGGVTRGINQEFKEVCTEVETGPGCN